MGFMFLHEQALACSNTILCRSRSCQFKHENYTRKEVVEENDDVVNLVNYSCDQCTYTVESEAWLSLYQTTPITVLFNGFDMFVLQISNDKPEHNPPTDSDAEDDENNH